MASERGGWPLPFWPKRLASLVASLVVRLKRLVASLVVRLMRLVASLVASLVMRLMRLGTRRTQAHQAPLSRKRI